MLLRALLLVASSLLPLLASAGVPYVPATDSQVLERLPTLASSRESKELRALRAALIRQPSNLPIALKLAQRYVALGRASGDPRYAGYAEAALAPWWNSEQPPAEVLLLRATLRQRMHQFAPALADLDRILKANPRDAQARLTKATILQVQGHFAAAAQECVALQALAHELVWTQCSANVQAGSGGLREAYDALLSVFGRYPNADASVRGWVLTSLAEMAMRAGRAQAAEAHFRAALTLDPADQYSLAAYSDFLLDSGRAAQVAELLQGELRADPLLLRYALALKALQHRDLSNRVEALRARFEASRLRGDRVHLREEARFALHLLGDAKRALALARENWSVQKEPADARILLEAALAADDASAAAAVRAWLREAKLEDASLARLTKARDRLPARKES